MDKAKVLIVADSLMNVGSERNVRKMLASTKDQLEINERGAEKTVDTFQKVLQYNPIMLGKYRLLTFLAEDGRVAR